MKHPSKSFSQARMVIWVLYTTLINKINKRMKKLVLLVAAIILTISLSAQFSATMTFTAAGMKRNFTVFSDNNRYRYEFDEGGQEGVMIILNETEEFFLLMPQQKIAITEKTSSEMSMGMDPLKQYEYFENEDVTEKVIGKETVNGYECIKKELHNIQKDEYGVTDQLMFTIWYSEELQFPVRILNHIDGTGSSGMEIRNIQPWTPDESSFRIPEGYNTLD